MALRRRSNWSKSGTSVTLTPFSQSDDEAEDTFLLSIFRAYVPAGSLASTSPIEPWAGEADQASGTGSTRAFASKETPCLQNSRLETAVPSPSGFVLPSRITTVQGRENS